MERWLPIKGYDGIYEISDLGRVRSFDRVLRDGRIWRGRTYDGKPNRKGHLSVRLCVDRNHDWRFIHRLVLEAFVGPCPEGMEGCHNDGVPSNNKLSNLRWDTRSGNHADKLKHGTIACGERNARARLTEEIVRDIYAMHARGVLGKDIARAVGVTAANISSILKSKTWRHLRKES